MKYILIFLLVLIIIAHSRQTNAIPIDNTGVNHVAQAAKSGVIAYDCSAPEANVSTYSLNQVDPCIITRQDVVTTEQMIIVVQKAERIKTRVQHCKMVIHRRMQHCGMHSHTSEVHNSYSYIVHAFTQSECQEAIQTGRIRLYNHVYISELKVNTTYRDEKVVVGYVHGNDCQGSLYVTNDHHWDDVLVFYRYEILLQEYDALANIESDTIRLSNGLICQYTTQSCLDSEEGYSYWVTDTATSCEDRDYEVIYTGPANKTIITNDNHYDLGPLYTAHMNTNMFTIRSKRPATICNFRGFTTDHNRIFIIESPSNINPFSRRIQESADLDLLTYFNSKIAFMEHHSREQMSSMYVQIMNEMCQLEKSLLETHLTLARINPTEFASKLMKKPGYTAVIAGEVIHVIHCIPVYVNLHTVDRCYQEIPIKYKGEEAYVAPVTRIIQRRGTEINCAPLLKAKFQIGSKWYTVSKELSDTSAPLILGSDVNHDWAYASLGDVLTSGLYDENTREKMKGLIYEQSDQRMISNVVHRVITGGSPDKQHVNFGHLLDDASIKSQFKKMWDDVMYWTNIVANIASSTFGLYIIFKALKFIVDTAVHCSILHDIYGLSWKLLAGIWDSLTALLEHRHMRRTSKQPSPPAYEMSSNRPDENAQLQQHGESEDEEEITATPVIYPQLPVGKSARHMKNLPRIHK